MNYYLIFAILGSVAGVSAFLPYLYHLVKDKTKPHVFSWFLWALLGWIAFFAQLSKGGGIGSIVIGTMALSCTIITAIAFFKKGKDYIKFIDWVFLISALIGIIIWLLTSNPLFAVIIASIVDACAFLPTFRKAFDKPYEETMSTYVLSGVQSIFSLLALESLNATTTIYPISLIFTNTTFVLLLLIRRRIYSSL